MSMNVLSQSAMEKLIEYHTNSWEVNTRFFGVTPKHVMDEIRNEGESRLDSKSASTMLANHEGLREFSVAEGGWNCMDATNGLSDLLLAVSNARISRKDWSCILELCLSNDLAWINFDRCDFTKWPSTLVSLLKQKMIIPTVPSLTSMCSRIIAREKHAYTAQCMRVGHSLSPPLTASINQGSNGVYFHSSNMNGHDPIPELPLPRSQFLRIASPCETWPLRVVEMCGQPRCVPQGVPSQVIGTGAGVWGAALAMCEAMEQMGVNWMKGEKERKERI
jgi:hypothetical protein